MNSRKPWLAGLIFIFQLVLVGCSATPQTRQLIETPPSSLSPKQELTDVPFFAQKDYQCGPAALATVLAYSELGVKPEALVSKVYVAERQGAFQVEMLAASRSLGRIPLKIEPTMESLLSWVDAGKPVLVLQNLGLDWYPRWHYAVVVGYDLLEAKMILRSGTIERYSVDMPVFERTWRRSEFWGFVTLQPGELPLAQNERLYFLAVAGFERRASSLDQKQSWLAGLTAWPNSVIIHMGLGNYWYRSGDKVEAEAIYHRIVGLDPAYAPAYNNLAQLKIEQGQYDEAIALINQAMAIDTRNQATYQQTLNKAIRLNADSAAQPSAEF